MKYKSIRFQKIYAYILLILYSFFVKLVYRFFLKTCYTIITVDEINFNYFSTFQLPDHRYSSFFRLVDDRRHRLFSHLSDAFFRVFCSPCSLFSMHSIRHDDCVLQAPQGPPQNSILPVIGQFLQA